MPDLGVRLVASISDFSSKMQAAASSVLKFGQDAKSTAGVVHNLEKAMDGLKSGAGRGSILDDFGKVLKGGGAVIGITLIGEELSKAIAKMVELNAEFRKGQVDGAGIAVKIGESIPIIGSFVTAGQNIRELFTHEKEQVDDANAAIKRQQEVYAELYKVKQEEIEKSYKLQRETEANNDAAGGIGLTGINAKTYSIDIEYKHKGEDLAHQIDEDVRKAQESLRKDTEKLYADLADMKARRANSTDGSNVAKELDINIGNTQSEIKTRQAATAKEIADIQAAAAKDQASVDALHLKRIQEAQEEAVKEAKQKGDLLALESTAQNKQLRNQGFGDEEFKKILDMKNAGLDPSDFIKQTLANQSAKGAQELDDLHEKLRQVQAAAAAGIDPKFGEAIQRMHLTADQAKDFEATSQAIEDVTRKAQQAREEQKQVDEKKAELQALKEVKDPEAAKQKNPQLAAIQEQIDLVKKRNEMLGEIPIEKAKAALADINKELMAGLITQDQAKQLQAKVTKDYNSATEGSKPLDVKAETSRSVKDLAATPKANNDVQKLLLANKQVDLQGQLVTYVQQLWQKFTGVGNSGDSSTVSLNSAT